MIKSRVAGYPTTSFTGVDSEADATPPKDFSAVTAVFVRGVFAASSSLGKVIPLLEARGLHVVAVHNRGAC